MLQGHVDVVAARGKWQHPPFAGELDDGYVWGRGALDMKGGVAMMLAAFMRAATAASQPPGDVILCVLADEEAGSDHGADFLVREHAELFEGVRYALGEFGGFTMQIAGRRFYPIMVAEKQVCWTRATLRGPAGHGSLPSPWWGDGQARAAVAAARPPAPARPRDAGRPRDGRRDRRRDAAPAGDSASRAAAAEGHRSAAGRARRPARRMFDPLLHNTASATIVGGGEKINVIPDEVSVEIDCRLLPGFGPQDVFAELRALAGVEMELEVIRFDPGAPEPDMGLFDTLAQALRELDPAAKPIPLLLPAVTDGRFFSRLGHSDVRLPAHAVAGGDALYAADPRRERAPAG